MQQQSAFDSSEKRTALATDIVYSIVRSRIIFRQACDLLIVPDSPSKPSVYGWRFLFTDRDLQALLQAKLAVVTSKEKDSLVRLLSSDCVIAAQRSVDDAASIPSMENIDRLSFGTGTQSADTMFLLVLPGEIEKDERVSVEYSREEVAERKRILSQKRNRLKTIPGNTDLCNLSLMMSLFTVFTTASIDSIRMFSPPVNKAYLPWMPEPLQIAATTNDICNATQSIIYKLRDLLLSYDSGQLPCVNIDKQMIKAVVTAELNTPYGPLHVEQTNAEISDRFSDERLNAKLVIADEAYRGKHAFAFDDYSLVPDLVYYMPPLMDPENPVTKLGISIGMENMFEENVGVPPVIAFLGTNYKDSWSTNELPNTLYTGNCPELVSDILSVAEILRFADLATLVAMKDELQIVERGVGRFYRFANSVQGLCAAELLLFSV